MAARRPPPELVSQADYAKRRGVSRQAVGLAIRYGRCPYVLVGGRKMIDPAAADAHWRENTDHSAPRNSETGDPGGGRPAGEKTNGNGAGHGVRYAQNRAVREYYMARLAQVELEERCGKLVRRETVTAAVARAHRLARDQVMGLADRLAGRLEGRKRGEIHKLLEEEARRICEDLESAADRR